MSTRLAAAAAVVVTAAAAVASPAAAATAPRAAATRIWPAAGAPAPAVPALAWKRCAEPDDRRLGLQCATMQVPLDYANPRGAKITLDLARRPATGPRKGIVLVNPGGPGEQATTAMGRFLQILGTPVTRGYDVIGMDPRGVGVSSQAQCWSRRPEPAQSSVLPRGAKEQAVRYAHDAFERAACAATGRPVIDHMSTGDAARDMDLVRQAMRRPSIGYYGVSYGSVLGQTYAAMFPSKVRAMVVDGVVDARAWTTGLGNGTTVPVSARTGSGQGADETLRSALAACRLAGAKRCAHGATIESEWQYLVQRLERGPVQTPDGPITLAALLGTALASLYDPASLRALVPEIHDAYLAVKGVRRTRAAARLSADPAPHLGWVLPTTPMPDGARWWDSFRQAGVMCSDSVNPTDPQAWAREANRLGTARSWFHGVWTWNSSTCAGWPGRSTGVYRGPFTVRPAHPLLVVGNTHDPATPLAAARAVAATSPGARLLTVDAYGHTATDKSSCALNAMRSYLAGGPLPRAGLVCRADKPLF